MEVVSELTSLGEALTRISFASLLLSSSNTLDIEPKILFKDTLLSSCNLSGSNVILLCVSSETQ